ncbi:MAG TPA: hypothetical protein VFH56_05020 [Acidimicrobiales bacterium]|nr:hypothetical protein [Acidimicrobiales bacterium]
MGVGGTVSAGYSGTPLAKKLGLKEGHALLLVGAPAGWSVPDMPAGVRVARGRPTSARVVESDIIIAFFGRAARLRKDAAAIAERLPRGSSLWVAWPRRAGGHQSDITDNLLREVLLPVGVVDIKVAALDEDWSGVRFVWRKANRTG